MEDLNQLIKEFTSRSPYDRNVFIMMQYSQNPDLVKIENAIIGTLKIYDLQGHLAKNKGVCNTLWNNVRVYMESCKYGIIVFEDLDRGNINPNISIELGYMLAKEKTCLVLKEKLMSKLPTDIGGLIYHGFNIKQLKTLKNEISKWIENDLQIKLQYTTLCELVENISSNVGNKYLYERSLPERLKSHFRWLPRYLEKTKDRCRHQSYR